MPVAFFFAPAFFGADFAAAEDADRPYERVRAILAVRDVTAVRSDGIGREDKDTVLSLLSLGWTPGPDGTGTLVLTFAGDGALAALLHDITANNYHRNNVPNSSKHKCKWLTYSSLAQVCKYANRVSYQVLNQHSPRLTRGLPEREDSLEEAYWDR